MSSVVLDASALVAVLNQEAGAASLTPEILSEAAISAVNVAEVQTKFVSWGADPEDAWEMTISPLREVVDFTAEQARLAGNLARLTGSFGLSLGDRACLALGLTLRAPVYTADRSWKKLEIGLRIHVIR